MSFRSVEAGIAVESFRSKFEQTPPYTEFIQALLDSGGLKEVVGKSHNLDAAYLAWQQVRKNGVPLTETGTSRVSLGTGFEGYFIGRVQSKEQMLDELLVVGKRIWSSIRLLHRNSYSTRSGLEKTIRGEKYSVAFLNEWMAIFGAELARQRAQILQNKQALTFREQNKKSTLLLPKIDYSMSPNGIIQQTYYLPNQNKSDSLVHTTMNDEDALALLTMQEIGKFGHPLVREAMRLIQS